MGRTYLRVPVSKQRAHRKRHPRHSAPSFSTVQHDEHVVTRVAEGPRAPRDSEIRAHSTSLLSGVRARRASASAVGSLTFVANPTLSRRRMHIHVMSS